MIEIIQGDDIARRKDVVEEMFRIRARVFHDILKWDVTVKDGLEIDQFDDADPLYLVSIDEETGEIQGSVRLLPTTGPNMLRDVFGCLMAEGEVVESPLVWESSRFSLNPDYSRHANSNLNTVTVELLLGLVEMGMAAGIEYIVSVYDARMSRIFKRANCAADIIGGPMKIGTVPTFAGLFDINAERWHSIASVADIRKPVIGNWSETYKLREALVAKELGYETR